MNALFDPSFFRKLVSFVFWIVILMAVFSFSNFLITVLFTKEYGNLVGMDIPLLFEKPMSWSLELGENWLSLSPEESSAYVNIKPSGPAGLVHPMYLFSVLMSCVIFAVMVLELHIIRQFLQQIIQKNFFSTENVQRLMRMGHLFLLGAGVRILDMLVTRIYLYHNRLLPENIQYDMISFFEDFFEGLGMVFLAYMLASVFQYGLKLKEQQDLTI